MQAPRDYQYGLGWSSGCLISASLASILSSGDSTLIFVGNPLPPEILRPQGKGFLEGKGAHRLEIKHSDGFI